MRGSAPRAPTRGITPGPILRMHQSLSTNNFPVKRKSPGFYRHGGKMPPAGCFASGKTEKGERERSLSLSPFYMVSLCPWKC